MTLADKHKVIEVLLCASDARAPNVYGVGSNLHDAKFARRCMDIRDRAWSKRPGLRYHEIAVFAAYRLIESSPTLRREWFGAS